jgi:uncharacterized RDD family membrane protein YckC
MEIPQNVDKSCSASLLRRFMAIFYDSLLLFAVLFFAAALAYPITQGQISLAYQLYLLSISFFYFAWPWRHGGQTLGMKAWRIQLQSVMDKPITWQQTLLRFGMAIVSWSVLGMGFLWALFDKQRRTWHDWISETHLVLQNYK